MRIAFFGTPEFALPALDALTREHEIVLVVAQPDKPAGRGMKLQAPAIAMRAKELALPLLQPPKVRDPQFLAAVVEMRPDIGIVIAYGKILPASLLEIPAHGFLNVHGSILPKWRGAAPIQRSIEAGDRITGVTIMRVDEELDHGPMLAIETLEIGTDERTPALASRLSRLGATALSASLRDLVAATAVETPQDHAEATYAAKLDKAEGLVTFAEGTASIYNRFRAFDPWPGLYTNEMKLIDLVPTSGSGEPGTILAIESDGVTVATADGAVRLITLQRSGKMRMAATDVVRGLGLRVGARLP